MPPVRRVSCGDGAGVLSLWGWGGGGVVGVSGPPFAPCSPSGGWGVLVGLLFEICIVDASIFATRCCFLGCASMVGVCLEGCLVVNRRGRFSLPVAQLCCMCWLVSLIGGRAGGVSFVAGACACWRVCCFDVVETSYEGHMVDALASRADEGRWSLR